MPFDPNGLIVLIIIILICTWADKEKKLQEKKARRTTKKHNYTEYRDIPKKPPVQKSQSQPQEPPTPKITHNHIDAVAGMMTLGWTKKQAMELVYKLPDDTPANLMKIAMRESSQGA